MKCRACFNTDTQSESYRPSLTRSIHTTMKWGYTLSRRRPLCARTLNFQHQQQEGDCGSKAQAQLFYWHSPESAKKRKLLFIRRKTKHAEDNLYTPPGTMPLNTGWKPKKYVQRRLRNKIYSQGLRDRSISLTSEGCWFLYRRNTIHSPREAALLLGLKY